MMLLIHRRGRCALCGVSLQGLWEETVIAVWQCMLSCSIGLSFFKVKYFPSHDGIHTRAFSTDSVCLRLIHHNVTDDDDDDDATNDKCMVIWGLSLSFIAV